jgi:hypothetical protein
VEIQLGDVKERGHWEAYQRAYAEAIGATAAPHAPWFIVPADDQWESVPSLGDWCANNWKIWTCTDADLGCDKELEGLKLRNSWKKSERVAIRVARIRDRIRGPPLGGSKLKGTLTFEPCLTVPNAGN